jgi:DNA-binding MarR family transcriptional regulator
VVIEAGERASAREGLIDALAQAGFATMAVLTKLGADNDLSLTQLRVLAILRDRRLRMTVLADYLGLEKSTMSGLVDRAERRGLLERAPSASDGRVVEVFLSHAGHDLADHLFPEIERSLSPLTDRLTIPEQRRAQALLERMLGSHDPFRTERGADEPHGSPGPV